MEKRKRLTDKRIADALKKTSGLQTKAAKLLQCDYTTIYRRIKKSEKLQQILEEVLETDLDIAEDVVKKVLHGKEISGKRPTLNTRLEVALKYLRMKGKERGYKEETDINVKQEQRPELPDDYRKLYKLKYGHFPEEVE